MSQYGIYTQVLTGWMVSTLLEAFMEWHSRTNNTIISIDIDPVQTTGGKSYRCKIKFLAPYDPERPLEVEESAARYNSYHNYNSYTQTYPHVNTQVYQGKAWEYDDYD